MGTDEEPGRCIPVEAEGRRRLRHRAGRSRSLKAHCAGHADYGPFPEVRPGLRKDLEALLREPGPVRGRVRPGMVQADPPRHGPALTLSRTGGSGRRTHLAGPHPCGQSQTDHCEGHRLAEGQDPGFRPARLRAGIGCLGLGVHLPRLRQARRRQRCPHPPRTAEGLGSQSACPAGEGAQDPGGHQEHLQQRCYRWKEGIAGRPDCSGRLCRRRAGREEGWSQGECSFHSGTHGRLAEADRCPLFRRARAGRGWLPQLPEVTLCRVVRRAAH